MIKIDCISDLHGDRPELEGGDLLIIAGDITGNDHIPQWADFYDWFKAQDYRKKILVAGNHDGFLEQCISTKAAKYLLEGDWEDEGFEYLKDSGTEFEGLKIWGSPWTKLFCDWHFMMENDKLIEHWEKIPNDTDILITHSPPYNILDECQRFGVGPKISQGCPGLRRKIESIAPLLSVFGHIHEGYGHLLLKNNGRDTWCINAAHMDGNYRPLNKPYTIIYDEKNKKMLPPTN